MNNLQKLDGVLLSLYILREDDLKKFLDSNFKQASGIIEFFKNKFNYTLPESELLILIDKLVEDKHIEQIPTKELEYRIRFNGVYFWEDEGGYEKRKNTSHSKQLIDSRKSDILFVGSVIGGCWALLKIIQILYPFFCHYCEPCH